MSKKETYGFTLDVKGFVRICLSDPATREMVYAAIREQEQPLNFRNPLGAANMKDDPSHPDAWYSAFVGTSNQVQPGQDGFVLRNNKGQGPRVSVRLKRQEPKQHLAQTASPAVTQTPGQVLGPAPSAAELLQRALSGDIEAAKAIKSFTQQTAQPAEKQTSEVNSDGYLTL